MDNWKPNLDHQIDLMKTMNFSEKDLAANRQGLLSDAQRATLRLRQWWGALGWWLLVGVGTLALLSPSQWSPVNSSNRLACLVVILIGLGMAFWRQSQVNQTLKSNRIAEISGSVAKLQHKERDKDVYLAFIAAKTFELDYNLYQGLKEGQEYSFYYFSETEELLSIEVPLTDAERKSLEIDEAGKEKEKRIAEPDGRVSKNDHLEESDQIQQISREDVY